MVKICLVDLIRIPLLAVLALVMSFASTADEVIPPLNVPVVNITSRLGSSSNAVHATLASGYGYWCKATISRYKTCTFWTSEISSVGGIAAIELYEKNTLTGVSKKTERFVASTDEDGNYRFKMASTSWSDSDPPSLEFYVHIRGTTGTSVTLSFQLAEVSEVLVGSRERPFRFDFLETERAPVEWYDTIEKTIRDNGYYYMASKLKAGERYYFGVSTNVPNTTLFSVLNPSGEEVMLSSVSRYAPWDSYETNVYDVATYLTNREERVTVYTKYTVVSNQNLSATNVFTVVGVYTNTIEDATLALSNFVAIVTNVDMSVSGVQTTVEVITNYEVTVLSIQTNIVQATNVSHIGMCRDAWKFVPEVSGDYTFLFKGGGVFTMFDATMEALPVGEDLSFSSPSGTFIPAGKALKLKLQCLKDLPSTNIYYTLDGSDPRRNGVLYTSSLKIEEPTVVQACLKLDDGDMGDVYTAYYYPARGNIGDALGIEAFDGVLSGAVSCWFEDIEKTDDGCRTIRNIPLKDEGSATFSLRIPYGGEFSFRWRCSSEELWDEAVFSTNGIEVARISGETKWEDGLISVSLSPDTELSWSYTKDDETSEGSDCIWLSDFCFEPSFVTIEEKGKSIQMPMEWFATYGLKDVGMAIARSTSGSDEIVAKINSLPRSLYESYVAGLNPTNENEKFEVSITMVDGKPELSWTPDLGEARQYKVFGSPDLTEGSWHSPTNASDRFFKIVVELP